jgi:hypothetical protein
MWSPPLRVDACPPPFLGQSGTIYWTGNSTQDNVIAYNCNHNSIRILPLPSYVADTVQNRCIGEHQGGGLRYAHFDFSVFEVWDLQREGENTCTLMKFRGIIVFAQLNISK